MYIYLFIVFIVYCNANIYNFHDEGHRPKRMEEINEWLYDLFIYIFILKFLFINWFFIYLFMYFFFYLLIFLIIIIRIFFLTVVSYSMYFEICGIA